MSLPAAEIATQPVPGDPATRMAGRRGMGWQSLSTIVAQVLQALMTLVVAAAVSPREFALWGVAAVVFNGQWLLGSLGLGQALIYFKDEHRSRDAVDGAFIVTAATGVTVALATCLAAPLIAGVFGAGFSRGEVIDVVRVMSLVFVFTMIGNVPQALIEKTLDFRRRAIPEMSCAVLYAVLTLALLAAGLGVWSLIIGRTAQMALLAVAYWVMAPIRPRRAPRLRPAVVGGLLKYGGFVSAASVVGFATGNLDTISVGRISGAAALGAYALAFTVTNVMPTFLSLTLGKVFFPIYAAVRGSAEAVREAYADAAHYLSLVMVPATLGFVVVAPDAFVALFGERWQRASALLRVLAIYGLLRAIGSTATVLVSGVGRAGQMLAAHSVALVASVALIWPLSSAGALGIAWAFTIGQAISTSYALWIVRDYLSTSLLRAAAGPAAASAAAAALAIAVRAVAAGKLGAWLALVSFALAYLMIVLVTDPRAREIARPLLRVPRRMRAATLP